MKRADVDTITVLTAVEQHSFSALSVLAETFPRKVVIAAFRRETARGRLDFGVAEELPWLTNVGRQVLRAARHAASDALAVWGVDQARTEAIELYLPDRNMFWLLGEVQPPGEWRKP